MSWSTSRRSEMTLTRWCLAAVVVCGLLSSLSAQVPDESVLPGTAPPPGTESLPDEKVLPDEADAQPAPPAELPGEDELPAGARATDVPGSVAPGASRPWLRLNLPGHTGTVLAVAAETTPEPFIVSGGEDKDLHVWTPDGPPERPWLHRRTIRWQVERGDRGRIYAAASSPHGVAYAGRGALGGNGEILIVDPLTGEIITPLVDNDVGHLQVIASLAWSPAKSRRLASIDVEGRVMLWEPDADTGLWSGRMLTPPDAQRYGEQLAVALESRRRFVQVAFLGPDHLLAARYVGPATDNPTAAAWHLEQIDIESGESEVFSTTEHINAVTALASSADGTLIASADLAGNCWLRRADDVDNPILLPTERIVLTLKFDGSTRLLVGTANQGDQESAETQIWNVSGEAPTRIGRLKVDDHVRDACWVNETQVAIAQAAQIEILTVNQDGSLAPEPLQSLAAPLWNTRRIAFQDQLPYRLVVEQPATDDAAPKVRFDLSQIQLDSLNDAALETIDAGAGQGTWNLTSVNTEQGPRYRLTVDGSPAAQLPLDPVVYGVATSLAWLADDAGEPSLLAVGTDRRCSVYLFQLAREGIAPLLREFRGHTGAVFSVGFSPDGRYLASASTDSTIRIWKTADATTAPLLANRWGLEFDPLDQDSQQLTVTAARQDGPLFFRGVRNGDQLISIRWVEGTQTRASSEPAEIVAALGTVPYTTEVTFQFARRGRPRPSFQSVAAWQPVLSLYLDADREWAVWTPAGYYDASFHGHRRFGWQLNRGLSQQPDFFTAAQFRKRLEKPAVIRQLLSAGDLPSAMRAAALPGPPPGDNALRDQLQLRPIIRITSPQDNATVTTGTVTVTGEIEIPLGARLVPPKVIANGVAAKTQTVQTIDDGQTGPEHYRFDAVVPLPSDPVIKLQVIAATDAEAAAEQTITLRQPQRPDPRRQPKLHLIALGINRYQDPQIQPLTLATAGVEQVSQLMRDRGAALYAVQTLQLKNERATKTMWRLAAEETIRQMLDDVLPDDVVILYLIGHGIRDRVDGRYYFVTADARYRDVMNDRYADLLSMADLAAFGQLPCRKIAILDTCHSGAIQSTIRSQDLKSALRALQEDVVLTLTASEGHEEAVEEADEGLSRFTLHLVEALRGRADVEDDSDRVVSLNEMIEYVKRAVSQDSAEDVFTQHPTAGPLDLLPYVRIPLTEAN